MPIYEYVCEKCGDQTEVMQKVNDAPLKRCKKCRGKLEKIFSRTAFQLKGSGWYQTDYGRKSAPKGKSEKSADTKPESGKSESGKTESGTSNAASGGGVSKD